MREGRLFKDADPVLYLAAVREAAKQDPGLVTLAQACDASSVSFSGEGQDVTVPPLSSDEPEEEPLEEGEDGIESEVRVLPEKTMASDLADIDGDL